MRDIKKKIKNMSKALEMCGTPFGMSTYTYWEFQKEWREEDTGRIFEDIMAKNFPILFLKLVEKY